MTHGAPGLGRDWVTSAAAQRLSLSVGPRDDGRSVGLTPPHRDVDPYRRSLCVRVYVRCPVRFISSVVYIACGHPPVNGPLPSCCWLTAAKQRGAVVNYQCPVVCVCGRVSWPIKRVFVFVYIGCFYVCPWDQRINHTGVPDLFPILATKPKVRATRVGCSTPLKPLRRPTLGEVAL